MISWLSSISGLGRAGRRTNVALLVVLVGAAATGALAFAAGTPISAMLATVAHGLFGLAVVLLVPWKTVIVRRAAIATTLALALVVLTSPASLPASSRSSEDTE